MAFKMNRPFRMNGPKKSGLKLGSKMSNSGTDTQIGKNLNDGNRNVFNMQDSSGLFYNSKMGPMQMMSPSALKQMEEEEATTETYPGGEVKSEREKEFSERHEQEVEKEDAQTGTIPGQDILSDGGNFYIEEGQDQIYIEDPDGILKGWSEEGDGYLTSDEDFIYELTEENYYRITGVADVSEGGEFEEGVPGHHANPQ